MTTDEMFERLRELQNVLVQKIEIEFEMAEIPKSLSAHEELVYRLKESYISKDAEYIAEKKRESECKNLLAIAESEREKAEKKMDSTVTQREIEALDKEIEDAAKKEDSHRRDLRGIEQKVLEINDTMKQNKELLDQQENELAERKKTVEKELSEKKKKLKTIAASEEKLKDGMSPELIFKFERIIRKKRGRGIVAVKGREHPVCQGCHMILPVQFAASVRQGTEVLSCPYCSSILYYEEIDENEEELFDDDDTGGLSDLDDLDDDLDDEDEDDDEVVVAGDYED